MRVEVDGQHFDVPDDATPDEIDSLTKPSAATPMSAAGAAMEGGLQGATLGWGDEMRGAGVALLKKLLPNSVGGSSAPMAQEYRAERDRARQSIEQAKQAHPTAYTAADLAGSLIPGTVATVATGGAAALPLAIGQGAASGAGYSDADSAGRLARDAGLGAGVGALGYGAGTALSKAMSGVGRYASGKVGQAQARAAEKAAGEVTAEIASARGSLGGEVQKGQRIVENLRRLGPELTPEEQAAVAQLEQRLTQSTREALPGQAGTIAAKDAELAALKTGASNAFQSRKADLLSTDEMAKQIFARARRYGPVAAGTALGALVGGPLGTGIGALAGAGTRPMIRSMRNLADNPAVQNAAWGGVENLSPQIGEMLRRALQAAAAGPLTQQAVSP